MTSWRVQSPGQFEPDLGKWGKRVRLLRERRGLSMRELEQRSGVGRSTISSIETGQHPNPGLDILLRLQYGLGLDTLEALLGDVPSTRLMVSDPDVEPRP